MVDIWIGMLWNNDHCWYQHFFPAINWTYLVVKQSISNHWRLWNSSRSNHFGVSLTTWWLSIESHNQWGVFNGIQELSHVLILRYWCSDLLIINAAHILRFIYQIPITINQVKSLGAWKLIRSNKKFQQSVEMFANSDIFWLPIEKQLSQMILIHFSFPLSFSLPCLFCHSSGNMILAGAPFAENFNRNMVLLHIWIYVTHHIHTEISLSLP